MPMAISTCSRCSARRCASPISTHPVGDWIDGRHRDAGRDHGAGRARRDRRRRAGRPRDLRRAATGARCCRGRKPTGRCCAPDRRSTPRCRPTPSSTRSLPRPDRCPRSTTLLAELDGLNVETQPQRVRAALARLLLVQPDPQARARPGDRRCRGDAQGRGRGAAADARLLAASRAADGARRRDGQLRPGDAARRRRRDGPVGDERRARDRARAGAGAGRRQAVRHRRGGPGAPAAPGAAHPPLDAQDRHARRLSSAAAARASARSPGALLRDCGNIIATARADDGGGAAHPGTARRAICSRSTTPTAPTASSPSSRCRWRRPIAGAS